MSGCVAKIRRKTEVVAAPVECAVDRVAGLGVVVVREVRDERVILDRLEQAQAERRRRDPEDHVVVGELSREVGLREVTTGCVGAPGDGVERVHAAIVAAVRVADEARLADRAVGLDTQALIKSATLVYIEDSLRNCIQVGPNVGDCERSLTATVLFGQKTDLYGELLKILGRAHFRRSF